MKNELRQCIVKGKKAYFHMWEVKSQVIPPSPMMGGHDGGVIKVTFAIVELEDGTVKECYPNEITFTDREVQK